MNTLQFGNPERRGLQQGADRMREGQFGAGEDHGADSTEIQFGWLREALREIFRSSPKPEYVAPQAGLQAYQDYQAYMPDPVTLRQTPAAKFFLETCRAHCLHRLH